MFDTFSMSEIDDANYYERCYIEQLLMKISDLESREAKREAHIADLKNRLAA